MPVLTGLWIVIGVVLAIVLLVVIVIAVIYYGLRHLPKPPLLPTLCPVCGHTEHEYKVGGLWDGKKDNGEAACGSFSFGVCKHCGSRWGQWDDKPTHVPTDKEWQDWVERGEERDEG